MLTKKRQILYWDIFKGLLAILMCFDHIIFKFPDLKALKNFVHHPLGFFTAAEGYVFITGLMFGRIYNSYITHHKNRELWKNLWLRLKKLYLIHLGMLVFVIVLVNFYAPLFYNSGEGYPLLQPFQAFIRGATFYYMPFGLDILPLYIILMLTIPFVLRGFNSKYSDLVIGGSFAIWLFVQFIDFGVSARVFLFSEYNIFAWQFLFVLALFWGAATGKSYFGKISKKLLKNNIFLYVCIGLSIAGILLRRDPWLFKILPEYYLGNIFSQRAVLSPSILLNFLAFYFVLQHYFKKIPFEKSPLAVNFANWIGKNSLFLYAASILLLWILDVVPLAKYNFSIGIQVGLVLIITLLPFIGIILYKKNLFAKDNLFYLAIGLLPILYILGFGTAYREPKIVAFYVIALACSFLLFKKLQKQKKIFANPIFILPLVFLAGQILSLLFSTNIGLTLQSIFITTSAIILSLFIFNFDFQLQKILPILLFSLTIIIGIITAKAYFDIRLVYDGTGLGALVGERNSCAIFLAQILPLLLGGIFYRYPFTKKNKSTACFYALATFLSIAAIILLRTRSAWWMLIFYGISFLSFVILTKFKKNIWRHLFLSFVVLVFSALIVVVTAPNKLQWRSNTPFLDSFTRLASFEHSNGREQLWRVGKQMIEDNPLLGVGAGNFPVWFRHYVDIAQENDPQIQPKTFAFLRKDLPIFNDYLQRTIEGGLPLGLIFLLMVLGIPLFALKKSLPLIKNKNKNAVSIVLPLLSCLALCISACFDYPFERIENIIFFVICLSYATKNLNFKMPYKFSKTFSWSLRGYAFASAVMIFLFGGSLFLRVSPVFEYHHTAWRIWPWDVHWTEYFIETELIHRHLDHAQTIADYRLRIWPYDPSSHIGQGLVAMYRNQSEDALLNFQKGLHQVRNGRCTWEASQRLTQFMRLPTTSVELKIAAAQSLQSCN